MDAYPLTFAVFAFPVFLFMLGFVAIIYFGIMLNRKCNATLGETIRQFSVETGLRFQSVGLLIPAPKADGVFRGVDVIVTVIQRSSIGREVSQSFILVSASQKLKNHSPSCVVRAGKKDIYDLFMKVPGVRLVSLAVPCLGLKKDFVGVGGKEFRDVFAVMAADESKAEGYIDGRVQEALVGIERYVSGEADAVTLAGDRAYLVLEPYSRPSLKRDPPAGNTSGGQTIGLDGTPLYADSKIIDTQTLKAALELAVDLVTKP